MIQIRDMQKTLLRTAGVALIFGGGATIATADEPCGDEIEECRVLIEINATDGDIGFHVLFDAEGWEVARIIDPDGKTIFKEKAQGGLNGQKLTENFFESAEPVCEVILKEDEDDEVVTLPEFLERFPMGFYDFRIKLEGGEELSGMTMLTHNIPAAPENLTFDNMTGLITWNYGGDLDECTTEPDGFAVAPVTDIAGYEVVVEPDVETPIAQFKYTTQVPRDAGMDLQSVSVPLDYLSKLPMDTDLKIEVGAIEERADGSFGNQTFTEVDELCNTPGGC